MEEIEKPLGLSLTYTIKDHFHVVKDHIIGKIPAFWEQYYMNFERSPQRKTPFTIYDPFVFR